MSATILAALLFVAPQPLLAQQKLKGAAFAPPAAEKDNGNRITISTELVSLTVTVTDKQGRYVAGLDRGAFAVYEDDVRQEISFFSDRDAPTSVGVVFDISGSMRGEKINHAREALAHFIQTSHPEDEYSLISFNGSAQLLLDRTRDSEALLARFSGINPSGSTALYDAAALGLDALAHSRYAKRDLISDGEDNKSRATLNQVKRRSLESGVTIYTILIGPLLSRSNGGAVMDELASASGGKPFFPGNAEAMSEDFEWSKGVISSRSTAHSTRSNNPVAAKSFNSERAFDQFLTGPNVMRAKKTVIDSLTLRLQTVENVEIWQLMSMAAQVDGRIHNP